MPWERLGRETGISLNASFIPFPCCCSRSLPPSLHRSPSARGSGFITYQRKAGEREEGPRAYITPEKDIATKLSFQNLKRPANSNSTYLNGLLGSPGTCPPPHTRQPSSHCGISIAQHVTAAHHLILMQTSQCHVSAVSRLHRRPCGHPGRAVENQSHGHFFVLLGALFRGPRPPCWMTLTKAIQHPPPNTQFSLVQDGNCPWEESNQHWMDVLKVSTPGYRLLPLSGSEEPTT